MKKAKKLATLALSSAMCLSMAAPAFASNTTKITGMYKEVPIAVTVPTTGTAIINPYGLPVKVESTHTTAADKVTLATISEQKVTTMPMAIYSKSEVDLLVTATVTGEVKGNLKLATAAIPANATTNSALIYLETLKSNLDESNLAAASSQTKFGPFEGWQAADADAGTEAGAIEAVVDEIEEWEATTYDADALNQILVGTTAKTKTIGCLTKGDADNDNALVSGGAMWFRLAGDVVSAPKTPWTSKDGAVVTVAFTFAPGESAGNPGEIKVTGTPTTASESTGVSLEIDTGDGKTYLKFDDTATYTWELVSGVTDSQAVVTADDSDSTKGKLTGFDKVGDYVVKVTVVQNNVPYVATKTITVAS